MGKALDRTSIRRRLKNRGNALSLKQNQLHIREEAAGQAVREVKALGFVQLADVHDKSGDARSARRL